MVDRSRRGRYSAINISTAARRLLGLEVATSMNPMLADPGDDEEMERDEDQRRGRIGATPRLGVAAAHLLILPPDRIPVPSASVSHRTPVSYRGFARTS
uniref:Uncharacterized protein n=1 Tax=Arundo donax TaxID=35708 RepID=A0A0A9KYB5_ARUDO